MDLHDRLKPVPDATSGGGPLNAVIVGVTLSVLGAGFAFAIPYAMSPTTTNVVPAGKPAVVVQPTQPPTFQTPVMPWDEMPWHARVDAPADAVSEREEQPPRKDERDENPGNAADPEDDRADDDDVGDHHDGSDDEGHDDSEGSGDDSDDGNSGDGDSGDDNSGDGNSGDDGTDDEGTGDGSSGDGDVDHGDNNGKDDVDDAGDPGKGGGKPGDKGGPPDDD